MKKVDHFPNLHWPGRHWAAFLLLILMLAACRQAADRESEPAEVADLVEVPEPAQVSSFAGAVPEGALARLGRGSLEVAAFSPDDRHIAAGGEVGVYLYSADTLEEVWHLPATSPVISVAFSPDGSWLASGVANGVVNLIHAPTGRVVQGTPPNNNDQNDVYALAWSDDPESEAGQLLAVGFNDGSVAVSRILSTGNNQSAGSPTIEVLGLLERSPGGVTAMAFSPNGQVLATGDRSGRINLWDAASFTWFGVLEGHERNKALLDLAWSPDGDQLLSGGKDGKVILWDVLTFEPLHQIAGPAGALKLSYSPDGLSFAAANSEGEIVIHQSAEPYQEGSAQTLDRELAGLAYSSGWDNIAAFTPTGELSLWPLVAEPAPEPIITLTGHGSSIASATAQAYSPDGQILATGLDDQVILWDTTTWMPLQLLSGHESGVTDLVWSPDGSEVASAARDHTVIVWDLESGQPRLRLAEHTKNVTDLAYAPDGHRLATAGSLDNTVIIWDLADGQSLGRFPGEGDGAWSVAWSPDSQSLAVGLTSGHVQLWAVDEPAEAGPLTTMIRHADWVSGLEYSPDGTLLASVGADGRLLVTRLEDKKAKTYAGHLGPIRRVHFSPDGAYLATAGIDGKTIIWDARPDASTDPLATFEGHTDSINDVGWSPDGKQLVSVSDDGTAIIWEFSSGP